MLNNLRKYKYRVVVFSQERQRIVDRLDAESKAIAEQMSAQIEHEDKDLKAWINTIAQN